jgi:uncharacterized protein with NRDE domain
MRNSILIPPTGIDNATADKVATAQTKNSGYDIPDHNNVQVRPEAGGYGTQKQTVILVNQNGSVKYVERTLYNQQGKSIPQKERDKVFEFEIEGWKSN